MIYAFTKVFMATFTFYDPHPGMLGALVPLPKPLRKAAQHLNGKKLTLEQALLELLPIVKEVGGELSVVKEHQYISYQHDTGRVTHLYRLIRYR